MDEKSKLNNGSFDKDLSNWETVLAVYKANDGVEFLGCAELDCDGKISQNFYSYGRKETVRWYQKNHGAEHTTTVNIYDLNDNVLYTKDFALSNSWTENSFEVGLYEGNFKIEFVNNCENEHAFYDEIWISELATTRAKVATVANTRLGEIATTLNYSTTKSGENTEGDYTQEITDSLVELGCVNEREQADIRFIETHDVPRLISKVVEKMMVKATNSFATMTDIRVGSRSENLSQIIDNIAKISSSDGKVGSAQIKQIPISYR
jgi:hypothetical protein